jgi:hypothetical protein
MRTPLPSALLLVLAAACASSAPGGPETTVVPMTTSLISNGGTLNIGGTTSYTAIATTLPVLPDSAYRLLQAAYAKLEIPVAQQDGKERSIGNDVLRVRRRLGGLTMQTVVDCGDKMGLPNAETWDISMNILSYVVPDGKGGSQLSTRIQAMGHDPSVSGREMISCGTRGELEAKIGNTVKLLAVNVKK